MEWPILWVYAGLISASVAAASYGVWAVRWARRRVVHLAALHAVVALVGVILIVAHMLSLTEPHLTSLRVRRAPFALLFTDIAFLLPAITRLIELKRDQRRDEVREVIESAVRARRNGGAAESGAP